MCLTPHKETGGEGEWEADGGKACCCLFSQIIYSKTGHNLLFISHILHQSDGSTFGEGSLRGLTMRLEVAEVTALLHSKLLLQLDNIFGVSGNIQAEYFQILWLY